MPSQIFCASSITTSSPNLAPYPKSHRTQETTMWIQPISSVQIQSSAPKFKTLNHPFPSSSSLKPSVSVRGSRRVYAPGSRVSTTRANALVPMVIESSPLGERSYDIFSRLLKDRIICISGPIGDDTSNVVVGQLLFLQAQDGSKPIYMYINSPGGAVTAGLAIYDTMMNLSAPVSTICMGQAASMGSLLLAAGAKGQRMSLPHSTVMIHQPSGGYQGQAKDMTIHTKQIVRTWDALNEIYVKHTGQEIDVIQKYMDRDFFMSAEEAKEFGLIDEVITRKPMALGTSAADDVVGLEKPQGPDLEPKDATSF